MSRTLNLSLLMPLFKAYMIWPLVFLAIVVSALLVIKPEWNAGKKSLQEERDALVIKNDSLLAIKLLLDKQLKLSYAKHSRCERENKKLRKKLLNAKYSPTHE